MLKKNKENNSKIKQFIKKHKTKIIVIICMLFSGIVSAAAATTIFSSSEVSFYNSDMEATNVQDAIDELWEKANNCSGSSTPDGYYVWDIDGHYVGDTFNTTGLTLNTVPSGRDIFLKYVLNGGIISETWACTTFGISGFEPVCVRGGKDVNNTAFYNYNNSPGNWKILNDLNSNTTFIGADGSCGFASDHSDCDVAHLNLGAYSNGKVTAIDYDTDAECVFSDDGSAICYH